MSEIPVFKQFTVFTPSTKVTILADDTSLPPNLPPPESYPANLVTVTTLPHQAEAGRGSPYSPSNMLPQENISENDVIHHLLHEGGVDEVTEVFKEESEFNTQLRHWDTYAPLGSMDTPFFHRRIQTGIPSDAYLQGIYFKAEKEEEKPKEYGPLPTTSYVSAPVFVSTKNDKKWKIKNKELCDFLDRFINCRCFNNCNEFCDRPELLCHC